MNIHATITCWCYFTSSPATAWAGELTESLIADPAGNPLVRLACCCGSPLARRTTFKFRYADGSPRQFLGCRRYPDCDATAALHDDGTLQSLPADAATRSARHNAHLAFDPLWQRGLMTRDEAYGRLMALLGLPRDLAHIGYLDAERCRAVTAHFAQVDIANAARTARRDERHASHHSRSRGREHRQARCALRVAEVNEDVREWGRGGATC